MLVSLSIKNYALIDELMVKFSEGYTIITGETGAGKSIVLGGLSLVLGKRADLSALKNTEEKCVVEAEFGISGYALQEFFTENDLDYEDYTFVRREILPSGKSRAFVNDTPVTLGVLNKLGDRLIDIHSQHQTLELAEEEFQYHFIDAVADNFEVLAQYKASLGAFTKAQKAYQKLIDDQKAAAKEYEYNVHLLKELENLKLDTINMEEMESGYEELSNVEEIREKLAQCIQLFSAEEIGVQPVLTEVKNAFGKLAGYGSVYQSLFERVQSVMIEVDDINIEMSSLEEKLDTDPAELERLQATLQKIYNLEKKHQVSGVKELLAIQQELKAKVSITENADDLLADKKNELDKIATGLEKLALKIHKNRAKVLPEIKKKLEGLIGELGMPNARFQLEIQLADKFMNNGKDELSFLLSANKGGNFGTLKKVASGGELSRIMFAIKSILSAYMKLPTIMFDEIDTGVSGEIAIKMAAMMKDMSKNMQVFCITHLPQVAARGDKHFKVYKENTLLGTTSNLKLLSKQERIAEIAQMLGGEKVTNSVLSHAKELLS